MAKDDSSDIVIAHGFNGETYTVSVADLRWRPSAYGIVIKDKKILLLRQVNGYDLPGGGLELGEMPETAVIREVKEETGIIVKKPQLIAITSSFYKPHLVVPDSYVQCLMIYYQCNFSGGKLSIEGFDEHEQQYAEAPEWIPLARLDKLKLGTTVDFRPFVKKALDV